MSAVQLKDLMNPLVKIETFTKTTSESISELTNVIVGHVSAASSFQTSLLKKVSKIHDVVAENTKIQQQIMKSVVENAALQNVYLSKTAVIGSKIGKTSKMFANFSRQIKSLKIWLSLNYHLVDKIFNAIKKYVGRTESKIKPHLPKIEGALKAFLLDKEATKQYV